MGGASSGNEEVTGHSAKRMPAHARVASRGGRNKATAIGDNDSRRSSLRVQDIVRRDMIRKASTGSKAAVQASINVQEGKAPLETTFRSIPRGPKQIVREIARQISLTEPAIRWARPRDRQSTSHAGPISHVIVGGRMAFTTDERTEGLVFEPSAATESRSASG